jgi:integrase
VPIKRESAMAKRGDGEGTITENKERRRWEGRLTVGWKPAQAPDGRQVLDAQGRPKMVPIRRKVTGRTRAEVVQQLDELRRSIDQGRDPASRTLTVARFLDDWLTEVLPGTVAPTTEQNYRLVVNYYLRPKLGMKRLRTLQPRDVSAMLRALEAEGKSPNTRRLARSVLRRALRWAEAEGMVARNVAALADGVKVGTPEGRTLTPDEARTLLASLRGHRLEAAFAVALALGLRRGELLGLSWDDIDLGAAPRLTVRRSLKRLDRGLTLAETKTKQSRRTLHLPGPVADQLRAHRERQEAERVVAGDLWHDRPLGADLVFRTAATGTAVDPDNFRNITYAVTEEAGIGRWSPHELRHSCSSLLLAQGVPLKTVSDVLGHSSIRVTADTYSHLLEPAKAEAADAMSAALWG